jgi:FkbM family methyltransferase
VPSRSRAAWTGLGLFALLAALWLLAGSATGLGLIHALATRLRPYTTVTTLEIEGVGPVRLFLNSNDKVVTPLIEAQGAWEPNETHWFVRSLRPGDTVVDAGANIGWYTVIAGKRVGDAGRVYAFEPDPEAFALLERNVRVNGLHNVVLEQKALSDAPGHIELFIAPDNKGDHRIYQPEGEHRASVQVEAVTLDDYFRDAPEGVDFVKSDTQGAELVILKGMRGLIEKSPSLVMAFEYAPKALAGLGGDAGEMLSIFQSHGFRMYDLGSGFGGVQPLHPVQPQVLLSRYDPHKEFFTNLLLLKGRDDLLPAPAPTPQ